MGNILLTALLILAAWAAWRTLRDKGESRRSSVEEAARTATERMTRTRDAETLEAGRDGVYRPSEKDRAERGD